MQTSFIMPGEFVKNLKIIAIDQIDWLLDGTLRNMAKLGIGIAKVSGLSGIDKFITLLDEGIQCQVVLINLNMPGNAGIYLLYQLYLRDFSGSIIMHRGGCSGAS